MIHECNLNCHTVDPTKLSDLGIEDEGKWMPFIFNMDMVEAAKLTSDDVDLPTYNCTTVFTKAGDAYIIDTPYTKFFSIFKEYITELDQDETTDEDLDL
jgi:hypothetical protein